MRLLKLSAMLAICLQISGCGLVVGSVIREHGRKTQEESQVVASLERYRQLTMKVDAERLADMFTVNGELSHNDDQPTVGHDNIRVFLANFAGYRVQDYELRATATTTARKLVTQHGQYSQTVLAPDGATIKASGEFDATWEHQSDGRWLLSRMHTSAPATTR